MRSLSVIKTQSWRLAVLAPVILLVAVALPGRSPARGSDEAGASIPNLTAVKAQIVAYHDSGVWDGEIQRITREARGYLDTSKGAGGRPAMVLDVDDTSLSNFSVLKGNDFGRTTTILLGGIADANAPPIEGTLDLYRHAKAQGVAVFFITGRNETLRADTERNLLRAGYVEWDGLILRSPTDMDVSVIPFKSGARQRLVEQGWRILINIGDQESDLTGGYAERVYKLPNPMYFLP